MTLVRPPGLALRWLSSVVQRILLQSDAVMMTEQVMWASPFVRDRDGGRWHPSINTRFAKAELRGMSSSICQRPGRPDPVPTTWRNERGQAALGQHCMDPRHLIKLTLLDAACPPSSSTHVCLVATSCRMQQPKGRNWLRC